GGSRYSRPRCIDLGSVGQPCRPYNSVPFNTTVSYPNGLSVDLTNVYFILCNCAQDLVCDRNEGTCRAPQIMTDNDLQ
ncbi:Astakine, partial [Blattella germanica]